MPGLDPGIFGNQRSLVPRFSGLRFAPLENDAQPQFVGFTPADASILTGPIPATMPSARRSARQR